VSEKYLNYYIETLTATLTDCVVRNVSLQANAKVTEEVVEEQSKKIEDLSKEQSKKIEDLSNQLDQKNKGDNDKIISLNHRIDSLHEENTRLKKEIIDLAAIRSEYENVKNQVNHVDTFRNELVKSRKETEDVRSEMNKIITELNAKIEYLQLPSAKKKKIDMLNKPEESLIETFAADESFKDGGSF